MPVARRDEPTARAPRRDRRVPDWDQRVLDSNSCVRLTSERALLCRRARASISRWAADTRTQKGRCARASCGSRPRSTSAADGSSRRTRHVRSGMAASTPSRGQRGWRMRRFAAELQSFAISNISRRPPAVSARQGRVVRWLRRRTPACSPRWMPSSSPRRAVRPDRGDGAGVHRGWPACDLRGHQEEGARRRMCEPRAGLASQGEGTGGADVRLPERSSQGRPLRCVRHRPERGLPSVSRWMSVGTSGDTAEFSTATIDRWWKSLGKQA